MCCIDEFERLNAIQRQAVHDVLDTSPFGSTETNTKPSIGGQYARSIAAVNLLTEPMIKSECMANTKLIHLVSVEPKGLVFEHIVNGLPLNGIQALEFIDTTHGYRNTMRQTDQSVSHVITQCNPSSQFRPNCVETSDPSYVLLVFVSFESIGQTSDGRGVAIQVVAFGCTRVDTLE